MEDGGWRIEDGCGVPGERYGAGLCCIGNGKEIGR